VVLKLVEQRNQKGTVDVVQDIWDSGTSVYKYRHTEELIYV